MTINIDELDPLYREVFKDPKNGTPDNITQSGCLALAAFGKEAWNTWRETYPVRNDTNGPLSKVFAEYKNIADFRNVNYPENISFEGFVFGDGACFDNAIFSRYSFFSSAKFGDLVSFRRAKFNLLTNFSKCKFGNNADFSGTFFSDVVNFLGAQFGGQVTFAGAFFQKASQFEGAQFGDDAEFTAVRFYGDIYFRARKLESLVYDDIDDAKKYAADWGLNPEVFNSISFKGAEFHGKADFSGRSFEGSTAFSCLDEPITISVLKENDSQSGISLPVGKPVVFKQSPLFNNCKFHQDISFDQAEFPEPTGSDEAARAYRTLKLAFSQQQATREELRFFRLEMAEEAKRARGVDRWLFATYRILGNYGFDYLRPVLFLLASVPIFAFIYGFMGATPCFSLRDTCEINFQFLEFSLIQAIPVPGLDKWSDSLRHCLFPVKLGGAAIVTTVIVMQRQFHCCSYF